MGATRKKKFQEECLDIRARKEEIEMRIKEVTDKGVADRHHMRAEIELLENNIKGAKETNLALATEIDKANEKNEQLVTEKKELASRADQAEIKKLHHESNLREKEAAIARNGDLMRAVRLRIAQLESECQGREVQNLKLRDEAKKTVLKLDEEEEKNRKCKLK